MTKLSVVKIALVTGSTDGVGRAVARTLAGQGYRVWVHGRDTARGEALARETAAQGGETRFVHADLASLAASALCELPRLDLLINNAGIGPVTPNVRGRELSPDGYHLRVAVTYLGSFLFTRWLLPLLEHGARARIVNVASLAHYRLEFENPILERAYGGMRAYAQSKLAPVLFTFDPAHEPCERGVTVTCADPATHMGTTMVRSMGVAPVNAVEGGAAAVMRLGCVAGLAACSGEFFDGCNRPRAHAQAYDPAARRRLTSPATHAVS